MKPLSGKAYGSIPHLPNSRTGPSDHHCHEGQAKICTVKTRDSRDNIYVTEKLDGSCVAIAKINGEIVALTRSGYTAASSQYEQHHLFDAWVKENQGLFKNLHEGYRIVGEWLAMAHGTLYAGEKDPFIAFDMFNDKNVRVPYAFFGSFTDRNKIPFARVISYGDAISVEEVMSKLDACGGYHGAIDSPEGAVWRVERDGKFDFMAKFVRHDKSDGKYFPEKTGKPAIYQRGFGGTA